MLYASVITSSPVGLTSSFATRQLEEITSKLDRMSSTDDVTASDATPGDGTTDNIQELHVPGRDTMILEWITTHVYVRYWQTQVSMKFRQDRDCCVDFLTCIDLVLTFPAQKTYSTYSRCGL